jgi:protease-4
MTEQRKSNFIVRVFRGLWNVFNFTRRLVFGVFAFVLILGVLMGLGGESSTLEEKTALVIAPQGSIVEQYSSDPMDRAITKTLGEENPEVQLRDILRALDAAAKDPKIDRVVLLPGGIESAGLSTLIEIGAALKRFKESKKELIAYGDGLEQRAYYLAAYADRIYLHPEGGVLLEGLGRYRTYFKNAFDRFGIEAKLFRVGEYKSAGEPYIRADASPEAKEADLYWMSDLWGRYLDDVAALRKIDAKKLSDQIGDYVSLIQANQGDLAMLALDQGLVDGLKTRDQLRDMLIEKGARDDETKSFRQVDLSDYLKHIDHGKLDLPKEQQIAIVVAEGEIVDGDPSPGMVGGDSTSKLIRKARENDKVKALVLRVDSPGGGVFPSELIRREVELTKKAGKPVIVSMGDLAASGGYWISMNADKIVASPSTITGSIGIFGLWVNYPQAMGKLGLTTDGVATTWVVGATNPAQAYDSRLGDVIQSIIDRGYEKFIGKVAEARGKKIEQIDAIARGRVWSGAQAKERGLVDELGTFRDAINMAAKAAKLGDDYQLTYVEKDQSEFEKIFADMLESKIVAQWAASEVGSFAHWLPKKEQADLIYARHLLTEAAKKNPAAIYARCDCELR